MNVEESHNVSKNTGKTNSIQAHLRDAKTSPMMSRKTRQAQAESITPSFQFVTSLPATAEMTKRRKSPFNTLENGGSSAQQNSILSQGGSKADPIEKVTQEVQDSVSIEFLDKHNRVFYKNKMKNMPELLMKLETTEFKNSKLSNPFGV